MNLSECTEQEINMQVAKIEGELLPVPKGCESEVIGDKLSYYTQAREIWHCHEDYCGDDALAFRLMVDNKIDLIHQVPSGNIVAVGPGSGDYVSSSGQSANRAIAECFILMSQEAKS